MRTKKGFTLIELLTVISIICILMAILLTVVGSVKRKTKAVVCLSNLRQWGMAYKMYTDQFDGRLPRDYNDLPWYYPISDYYMNEKKLLLCPMARKPSGDEAKEYGKHASFGGAFRAWGPVSTPDEDESWNRIGSYGLNHWAYKSEEKIEPPEDEEEEQEAGGHHHPGGGGGGGIFTVGRPSRRRVQLGRIHPKPSGNDAYAEGQGDSTDLENTILYWGTAYEKRPDNIPLLVDSSWMFTFYKEDAGPPKNDKADLKFSGYTNTCCFDRHDGGVNGLFMDFSARKIGLKELWTIKWHKNYNTAGPWTKAGGVQPEDWPKWMRKYKDY